MSDVTVLSFEIENSLWCPLWIQCDTSDTLAHSLGTTDCATQVMHAYESNLGVSDPRSMSFFFFFNATVLVVNINFYSV